MGDKLKTLTVYTNFSCRAARRVWTPATVGREGVEVLQVV